MGLSPLGRGFEPELPISPDHRPLPELLRSSESFGRFGSPYHTASARGGAVCVQERGENFWFCKSATSLSYKVRTCTMYYYEYQAKILK